jgi:hypothetical protein
VAPKPNTASPPANGRAKIICVNDELMRQSVQRQTSLGPFLRLAGKVMAMEG